MAKQLNDTHTEKLGFVQGFIEIEAWLFLIFLVCLHNQLNSIHSIVTYERLQMFQKGDSSNRQLLFSASFMAKLELVFRLTLSVRGFILKPTKKSIGSSKIWY